MTTADRLRAEGRAEGEARGEARGRAAVLLRLLTKRFGTLPDDLLARVHGATPDDLDRWADRILVAKSLAEVFASK